MNRNLRFLGAKRILVVAPHPDDESLGCGGLIAKLAAAGRLFHTLFVTDGGASHPASLKWPRRRLTAQREQEAAGALHFLGIGSHARTFLRLRDADMPSANSIEWRAALVAAAEVVRDFRPDLALLPWRRDPHCDHRASWHLAQAAIQPMKALPLRLEYAIWLDELGAAHDYPRPGEAEQVAIDVSSELTCKRAAIAAHRTQTTSLIGDDPNGFRLMPATIDRLTGTIENYYCVK
jgi:LmbE family N-acetylglucosaminyl deacetylase